MTGAAPLAAPQADPVFHMDEEADAGTTPGGRRAAGQLVPSAVARERRQRRHVHRSRVERIVGRLAGSRRRMLRRRPTRSSIRSRRPIPRPTLLPTRRPSPIPCRIPHRTRCRTRHRSPTPCPIPHPTRCRTRRPSRSRFPTRPRIRPNRPRRRHEPAALVDGRADSGHGRLGRRRSARAADARRPSSGCTPGSPGPEASGKSTLLDELAVALRTEGMDVVRGLDEYGRAERRPRARRPPDRRCGTPRRR